MPDDELDEEDELELDEELELEDELEDDELELLDEELELLDDELLDGVVPVWPPQPTKSAVTRHAVK